MTEIYEIDTPAGPALVEADSSAKAVGFARRGIKARRLSGAEVRALPATPACWTPRRARRRRPEMHPAMPTAGRAEP